MQPRVDRYILMRHDPDGRNLAYLYDHSKVIETVGEGKAAVDIVCTSGDSEGQADFFARYQLDRLYSGMEARNNTVFADLGRARYEARHTVEVLSEHL